MWILTGQPPLFSFSGLSFVRHPDLARPVLALLVAQHFEPDEEIDFARAVAQVHVPEVTLVDELEVLGALLGRTHVGRDAVLRGPVLRQPSEHRIAIREIRVDRANEFALEFERDIPDEALQDGAHVFAANQQIPNDPGEALAQFVLLELPGDSLRSVRHEHRTERLRRLEQPVAQQRELLLEELDFIAVFERFQLRARGLEIAVRTQILLQVVVVAARSGAARRDRHDPHRMISASQLAAARWALAMSSGVTVIFSSCARDDASHFLGLPVNHDLRLFEQLAHVLITGLAVRAFGHVGDADQVPSPRRWKEPRRFFPAPWSSSVTDRP